MGAIVNSPKRDGFPQFAENDLAIYFSSDRNPTHGKADLFVTRRSEIGGAWSRPVNLGPAVNTRHAEVSPVLTKDGLTLFFGSGPAPKTGGGMDIWVSQRESLTSRWQKARRLGVGTGINRNIMVEIPYLITDDGRSMLFHRFRTLGGNSVVETWVTHRESPDEASKTGE